nr:hypothetical protein [Tanacetum cinerariifolium]
QNHDQNPPIPCPLIGFNLSPQFLLFVSCGKWGSMGLPGWLLVGEVLMSQETLFGSCRSGVEVGCQQMLPGPTVVTVEVRIAPPHHVPSGCMGCFANRCKGKRKPNLGGRAAGRLNTHDKTRNLSLKEITITKGPVPIQFELRDKQTIMPLGDHAAHWSSYSGEVIRGVPLYYPSWLKVPKERKATLITDIW